MEGMDIHIAQQLRYPVGIQSFAAIRERGFLYVDKTALIHRLISSGKYYFLSRPRRFGKSLLLSTIESYYLGRRELFKGLAIDSLTDDWEAHPVLHLDLNSEEYEDYESLRNKLSFELSQWELKYGVETLPQTSLSSRFSMVISKAYEITGKTVVILIDEYDKPMLHAIDNPALADRFRSTLKAFYGNLKSMDDYIEFAMLTGVARFSKVSIFSDLNNLRDITFQNDYAGICGITEAELARDFKVGIHALAEANGINDSQAIALLKEWYDGYHFAFNNLDVYNPFSLMNVFAANQLDNYWFQSGTPTYLARALQKRPMPLRMLSGYRIGKMALAAAGVMTQDPVALLYQSGYLSIAHYDSEFAEVELDYPNREVKESFLKFLVPYYTNLCEQESEFAINRFSRDVRDGKPEDFMRRLSALVAATPYGGKGSSPEDHFQNIIYLVFTLMGYRACVEQRVSRGRIDLSVETLEHVYIFEFKINASSESATDQIVNRGYDEAFKASGKQIILIGANFDSKTRHLTDEHIVRI